MTRETSFPYAARLLRTHAYAGGGWSLLCALLIGALSTGGAKSALLALYSTLSFVVVSSFCFSALLRRQVEEEEGYRATFEHSGVCVAHVSPGGVFFRVNSTFCELLGYSREELVNLHFLKLTDPDDQDLSEQLFSQLLKGEVERYSIEKRYVKKDGRTIWATLNMSPVRSSGGEISYLIGVIQDISASKKAEEDLARYREHLEELVAERSAKLLKSEVTLNDAQHISHIGSWELDIPEGRLTWSDELYRILEVDPAHCQPSRDTFLALLSRQDREKVREIHDRSVANRTPYDLDHRLVFPDGRVKHLHEHCHTYYDKSGLPCRSVGTLQDVTSHWETEEKLRQFSRVVEQSPVSVVITDLRGNIIYVNPKFSRLTGYTFEEAVGRNPRILRTDFTPHETYREMWHALAAEKEWRGEFCNRKKDGSLYWEKAYISPVVNAAGRTTHFVAVKEDITEQKDTEEKLRELSLADSLTGLTNRRGFMVLAEQQIKVSDRIGKGFLLLYADIDGMKSINDTLGHAEGDRALKDVASILRASFRNSDVIARLGGDEFVAMSLEAAEASAETMTERVLASLEAHNDRGDRPYPLQVSFGITRYNPGEPCTVEELLERGDRLMYEVKRQRKRACALQVREEPRVAPAP